MLGQPVGYIRDIHFAVEHVSLPTELEITNLAGFTRLNRTAQGILVQAEFTGVTSAQCVRCLADFLQPLKTTFSELYAIDQRSTTDADLILPEDGNLDLEPLLGEYMLLEVPISPLCKPDCKGLCPICGEDLNFITCEHVATQNFNL
ncbi:MAG TPA: DUF177 domain-containing protein [Anaerolineaceae bacterium]